MGTASAWTPERRKKQSEVVHRWTLWNSSTGPKTEGGKRASAYRGLKHGRRSASVHAAGAITASISRLACELDE